MLIQNLASILTSEVAPWSAEAIYVYYWKIERLRDYRNSICVGTEKQQKQWQISRSALRRFHVKNESLTNLYSIGISVRNNGP